MTHTGRPDAREGESIVEPCRRAAAQIRADGVMNRCENLKQHEHGSGKREGRGQVVVPLHRGDEHTYRDREQDRQQSAEDEQRPPGNRQWPIGLEQNPRECPFVTRAQALDHRMAPCSTRRIRIENRAPQAGKTRLRLTLVRLCRIGISEAGNVLVSERGERRVARVRRETAPAPQRGCRAGGPHRRAESRPGHGPGRRCAHLPGDAVSRAVEQFAEQHGSGHFSSI